MHQKQVLTKDLFYKLLGLLEKTPENDLVEVSKKLLHLAQNLEKFLPGLDNLKNTYIP